MNDLILSPALATAASLTFLFLGIVIGSLLAKGGRKEQVENSYKDGVRDGANEARETAKAEKEELAVSLAEQFGDMREGIVQTVQAYQRAVESCGEKLSLPEQDLLRLDTTERRPDIEIETDTISQTGEEEIQLQNESDVADETEEISASESQDVQEEHQSSNADEPVEEDDIEEEKEIEEPLSSQSAVDSEGGEESSRSTTADETSEDGSDVEKQAAVSAEETANSDPAKSQERIIH